MKEKKIVSQLMKLPLLFFYIKLQCRTIHFYGAKLNFFENSFLDNICLTLNNQLVLRGELFIHDNDIYLFYVRSSFKFLILLV